MKIFFVLSLVVTFCLFFTGCSLLTSSTQSEKNIETQIITKIEIINNETHSLLEVSSKEEIWVFSEFLDSILQSDYNISMPDSYSEQQMNYRINLYKDNVAILSKNKYTKMGELKLSFPDNLIIIEPNIPIFQSEATIFYSLTDEDKDLIKSMIQNKDN